MHNNNKYHPLISRIYVFVFHCLVAAFLFGGSMFLFGSSVFAMTTSASEELNIVDQETIPENTDSTVYLLGWRGNKLHTTVGTIMTTGIIIENKTGLTKSELSVLKKLPVAQVIKGNGKILKIVISL